HTASLTHSHCYVSPSFPSLLPPPPTSTLFPYTTLFRSHYESVSDPLPHGRCARRHLGRARQHASGRLALAHVRHRQGVGHVPARSEEHTSELQSLRHLVCRLLLEKKKKKQKNNKKQISI